MDNRELLNSAVRNRYHKYVASVRRRLLNAGAYHIEAGDVIGSAMRTFLEDLDETVNVYEGEAQIACVFWGVLRNKLMDRTKQSWRLRQFEGGPDPDEIATAYDKNASLIDSEIEVLWGHVNALPSQMRAIVVYRFAGEKSFDEISGLIGIPRTTVRERLDEALKILSTRLS